MTSTSVAIAVTFATLVLVPAPAELQDRKAGGPRAFALRINMARTPKPS